MGHTYEYILMLYFEAIHSYIDDHNSVVLYYPKQCQTKLFWIIAITAYRTVTNYFWDNRTNLQVKIDCNNRQLTENRMITALFYLNWNPIFVIIFLTEPIRNSILDNQIKPQNLQGHEF